MCALTELYVHHSHISLRLVSPVAALCAAGLTGTDRQQAAPPLNEG